MNDKKLFLLDAYALIYRAYYAMIRAPRFTSRGFNTSAIFGFVNTLEEILQKENPSHIAVCFDPHGSTFRHEAYPEYKAQRDKQPEDITASLPYIKDIISAYNIAIVEVPGYEADDVIGTLSRQAESQGFTTYMMTPDKDYGQLVTDKVYIYRPSSKGGESEIRGPQQVCERYGVTSPSQVIDLLALEGDAVDNVPGCPGVGEKTAVKLIEEWGSVENLIANVENLKGALQKKISENVEKIRFSKFLVTIKTDVPVSLDVDDFARKEVDVDKLVDIFTELEFKQFIKRTLDRAGRKESTQSAVSQQYIEPTMPATDGMMSLFDMIDSRPQTMASESITACDYAIVDNVESLTKIIDEAIASPAVGFTVYGVGVDTMSEVICGIAISTAENKARYVALNPESRDFDAIIAELTRLCQSPDVVMVSHDVKHDYLLLKRLGIPMIADYYDTSVAHYLLEPEMNHSLGRVAAAYLDYRILDYDDDSSSRKKSAIPLPVGEEMQRLCEVADVTLRLFKVMKSNIAEKGLGNLMDEIELPLVKVLADMEWNGVRVDVKQLASLSRKLTAQMHDMERQTYELAGGPFNIASPMQVGEVLFERLKIDEKARRTKRGSYSTTEEVLEKYRTAHPIVGLILDIRGMRKLLATYIDALPSLINSSTGRIHTTFNQTATATGRLSSANPNLQNIPIRTDNGREIRRAFVADHGHLLLSADYSQIELRVIADLSKDPDMIGAFLSGADIHRATAARIYNELMENVTEEQRRRAKTANFGIIYGISAFGLSERLHIPRSEAKMLIDGYFATYPRVRDYIDSSIEKARNDGFVTTIKGRKRMLPDINSRNAVVRGYAERNAVNAPIQGSAADIIKIAMVNIVRDMQQEGLKSRMLIQVHDELVFDVVPDELERLMQIVISDMKNAYHGNVPLEVSTGSGSNWLDAH